MSMMSSPVVGYAAHILMFGSLATLAYALRDQLQGGARFVSEHSGPDLNGRGHRDSVILGVAAFGAVTAVVIFLGLPVFVAAIFGIVFAIATPVYHKRRRREAYMRNFDGALAEALQTVSASLRAGLTLKDSLHISTENGDPAFTKEISHALKEYRFGVPIETALDNLRRRVPTAHANIAFGAMIVSSRLGGRLPEILKDIVMTIRERERVEGKLKALTSQGRAQSVILMAAPPLMGIGLYLYDPAKMELLTNFWLGQILLTIAIVLEIIGIAVTSRIMKLEV